MESNRAGEKVLQRAKWLFSTADSSTATAGPARGLQHHEQRQRAARPAGEPLAAPQRLRAAQSSNDAPLRPWRQKPSHSPEWRFIEMFLHKSSDITEERTQRTHIFRWHGSNNRTGRFSDRTAPRSIYCVGTSCHSPAKRLN